MKLYVVVDGSLPVGAQIAQSVHAAIEYTIHACIPAAKWYVNSNTVVCLATESTYELHELRDRLWLKDIPPYEFREPDLDNRLTAIAFIASKNPCGHLPLAPRFGSSMAEQ